MSIITSSAGTPFAMLEPQAGEPAPTLLLLAMTASDTLTTQPYCRVGQLLHARGWNVVSLDLPCHGADSRSGEPPELAGWAARTAAGRDFVSAFQEQVSKVLAHLMATGLADPARIAAAGTSRGGFMAFQAAAGNPLIRAVAAFAPVTDLIALREFAGQDQNPLVQRLALTNAVEKLAGRPAWLTIGDSDSRVGTDRVIAFADALREKAQVVPSRIILRVLPTPGHSSFPEWHEEAADWLEGS